MRAVGYPLISFTLPFLWWTLWRERMSFPWLSDLLITLTCFSDILGNRMDLYDTVVWFDDLMHFANTGLLAAAFILLTLPRDIGFGRVLERALAFGATAAIAWELAEFFAFISKSTEREFAYADTLGDLSLGVAGAVVAAVVLHRSWRHGRLLDPEPLPRASRPDLARGLDAPHTARDLDRSNPVATLEEEVPTRGGDHASDRRAQRAPRHLRGKIEAAVGRDDIESPSSWPRPTRTTPSC